VVAGSRHRAIVEVAEALLKHRTQIEDGIHVCTRESMAAKGDERTKPPAYVVLRNGAASAEAALVVYVTALLAACKSRRWVTLLPKVPKSGAVQGAAIVAWLLFVGVSLAQPANR
jgi:hypothetical protein